MINEIETTWASKLLFFLLCATIIFTTLAYGAVHHPIIAIFYVIAAIVVLLWVFDAFTNGVLRFNKSLLQIPLLAAFLYGILQTIPFGAHTEVAGLVEISRTISFDPFWTQVAAFHFLALLIFLAALLTYIDSAKRLNKIVLVITIFGFVFAFFAVLQSVLSPNKIYGIYEVDYATPFGSFVNRHNFAAFMEMSIAVPVGLMFVGAVQKDKKLLYVTAIALMGIALILSGSRGGLISLLAEIFFLLIVTTKTKGYNQVLIKVGLAVLLVATIIFGSMLIGGESSLTRLAETATSEDFSTNRTHIWDVTLNIIKNNFIFGTGYGSFGVAYTPYDSFNGLERVEQAHNDYLQILADAGIIGLIIAGFFIFTLFRTGLKNTRTSIPFRRGVAVGALAGCFAILVHSLFDFVLHTTAIAMMFITLVSLVVVSGNKFPEDSPDISKKRSKKRRTENVIPIGKRRENLIVDENNKTS
ncbi:MAG: O-antigen ligase family protein [Acidobacteriota bacterium]|jgi:O-antigen ligase|nr:O-antigen ligase family protein [Acidobacteriota bacterium]MDQ3373063.1 O-antigen ligase family protein [Acidobacteriota bacterium]